MSEQPIIDADYIRTRLEEACATLQAIPGRVGPAKLSAQSYGYVPELVEFAHAAADEIQPARKAVTACDVEAMDEALGWLGLIFNRTHRKIVAARSLVNHHTGKPRYSWKAIGAMVKADYRSVKTWHEQALNSLANKVRIVRNYREN